MSDKKVIKFRDYLVPLVLSGEKNSTWRLFDDKDFQEGDEIDLINKATLEKFGQAIITSVVENKIKDIKDSDFDGHEKYESEQKMYDEFRKYYGEMVVPETIVKIIKFKLIS